MNDYPLQAKEVRKKVLDLIYQHQTSHIGSNLSVIDMAVVLYNNLKPEDEVVWSAGWKSATVCVLENKPFTAMLDTGSCGHGLPIAVGKALAKKRKYEQTANQLGENDAWPNLGNVYVIMSEGELQEGTTWESAMLASRLKLNNLIVLVDYNGYQAMGKTLYGNFTDKWLAFGWKVMESDGHDEGAIRNIWTEDFNGIGFGAVPQSFSSVTMPWSSYGDDSLKHKPMCVICQTIKGKGVDFMENNNDYHYKNLTKEEYERALAQLDT